MSARAERLRPAALRTLAVMLAVALRAVPASAAGGRVVHFDPRLLFGGVADASQLSSYEHDRTVPPGRYRSEVFCNGNFVQSADVLVRARGRPPRPEVCLGRDVVRRAGIDPRRLSRRAREWLDGRGAPDCLPARDIAPGLQATFDLSRLRVDIAAADTLLPHRPRGWISPRSWSNGIMAARLNYQFNAVRSQAAGAAGSTRMFLGLAAGANAGAWQLRHSGTLAGTSGQELHYTSVGSFLRHDVASLRGYVQLGQGRTDGQLFDSVGFQGVLLASEPRMLPASERGYAPVIRGFAAAPSTVRVTQGGTLLYQTSVPAGAFEIDDLYPPAAGAALQVTLTRPDGRSSVFTVPVSTLPQLQRPGHASYRILAARLRSPDSPVSWPAVLGSLLYGLNNTVTGELGLIAAAHYRSEALGAALNTRLGALALDVTRSCLSDARLGRLRGSRVRATWNLLRGATGLSWSASGQSRDFYGPQDALNAAGAATSTAVSPFASGRVHGLVQVQWTRSVDARASWYLTGASTSYWDLAQRQTTLQLGYVRSFGPAQLTVTLSRQLGASGSGASNAVSVGLSLPLGSGPRAPTASFAVQRETQVGSSAQWALAGNAGSAGTWSYGVQAAAGAGSRSASVDAAWRGSAGTVGAAATAGAGAQSLSLSANGGVVAFDGGVAFTPYLGDTIALIEARGASGATVVGGNGSRIDADGYGVATYLTPYQADTVSIEPTDAVAMARTSARVVPRAGAIVRVHLRSRHGRWVLISARRSGGRAVPFGARVFARAGRLVGYVGQDSRIDAHLREDAGRLLVRWGDGTDKACSIAYQLRQRRGASTAPLLFDAICAPLPPGKGR